MMAISYRMMDRVYDDAVGKYISEYMGLAFEEICRQYLLCHFDSLPFIPSELGEWWGTDPVRKKEAQLDIVGIGPNGGKYLIGSCKFRNELIGSDELTLIRDYASLITQNRDRCFYYIFSKSGFTKDLMKKQTDGEVSLVSLNDMY